MCFDESDLFLYLSFLLLGLFENDTNLVNYLTLASPFEHNKVNEFTFLTYNFKIIDFHPKKIKIVDFHSVW